MSEKKQLEIWIINMIENRVKYLTLFFMYKGIKCHKEEKDFYEKAVEATSRVLFPCVSSVII